MKKTLYSLLFSLLLVGTAFSQTYFTAKDTTQQYQIVLKDGTKFKGKIISQDAQKARIQTPNLGEISIDASQIQKIESLTASTASEGYRNQFSHTLNTFPTAYGMEQKRTDFNNTWLFYSDFNFGISERITGSVGFLTFTPTVFANFGLKATLVQTEKGAFAIQGNYLTIRNAGGVTSLSGIGTLGSREKNVTIGLSTFLGSNGGAILTVGRVAKVSPKLTFLSQNHFLLGNGTSLGLLSGGLRFDRNNHAFDLLLYVPFASSFSGFEPILIPVVSYHLKIGK